jgi:D-hydroxyproline dehydrogenase subunit alpha
MKGGVKLPKLQTRRGKGRQGRVCGPATRFLFKWNPDSVRPPLFPARVEGLTMPVSRPEREHRRTTGGYR